MYDISINADGRKWQPNAGEPVRVDVELDEPVPVTDIASLGVVHLADDGTVDELEASRYGFTFNADKTAATAFWFSATGFSIYAIVDAGNNLVTPRRFYHFYGHPTTVDGLSSTLPYLYHDESNDVVNVQIVKDGDILKEPPIPLDVLDEHGEIKSIFEGWYVVSNHVRSASAVESKLDPTNEYFQFVWPVGATDRRMTFTNAVSVTETEDWDYYVVPLYEHARFLQFNENSHAETDHGAAARIIRRKLVAINEETGEATLKVSDVEAALKNSRDEYFCGWEYLGVDGQLRQLPVYSGAGKPQDQYITVDDALFEANGGTVIQLYPYYVSAHFLNFDSNAGGAHAKYVGSIFVRSSSNFSIVETSGERKGYNFAGWRAGFKDEDTKEVTLGEVVTDASGNFIPNKTITNPLTGAVAFYTDAQGNIRMNEDVTLYGTWAANSDSTYRVIIWQQRATDSKNATDAEKKYYYVTHYTSPVVSATTQISESMITSFTGTAASGTNPNRSNLTTISGKDNLTDEDFTGFHYGRWECKDETVAPDASTVINVYYDRDLITLRFCLYDRNQTETIYTTTTATSGDIYGTDDGENYFDVYYNNGQWYKTRTSVPGYTYATEYTGDRYRKTGTGNKDADFTKVSSTDNEGTQYHRRNSNDYREIYYDEAEGKWYRNRTETTTYAYSNPYSGYRYTATTSNWIVNQTMTGLYGQTLASNGYTWPSGRRWYDGQSGSSTSGTQISFLDAFLPTSGGDETFYSTTTTSTSSSNTKVYFYKENLDGTWLLANEFDSGSSSVNFNISDKYDGFQAHQYSTDGGSTWKSVGAYNEDTGYYGSQVTGSKLSIRFKRNVHELIYKYEDENGEHILRNTGKTILYESPLAAYEVAYTNLDWNGCDITNRTFKGWYEDASLTVPFDFGGTMPDAKKVVYAKWSPLQYKVIIDPNGGELLGNDSTWFYVDPDKNETIKEYHPTRDYRLDMHNGTYYYHHDLWNPLGDKHVTDTNSPSFIPNISRKAFYTTDIAQATSNEVSNPENRYTYDPGAYAFMGWYEVLADGTLAVDPFSFGEPPTRNVTLRAIWRRTGIYTLKYESIDPDGWQDDEVIYDPLRHATGNIEDGYVADAETTLAKAPTNYDKNEWIWEGWQAVDTYNNNIPLTTIRSPGDIYRVKPAHADPNNVIHFRAVFKYIGDGSSRHIPPVTDMILDSNENAGIDSTATIPQRAGSGIYTDGSSVSVGGFNQGVWFAGQQNNFSVDLADYSSLFAHANGYFLLGWDPLMKVDSLVPTYTAEQTVGVDKSAGGENVLYAVWEPQVYIDFVNDTDANLTGVTLYIPSWVDGELFRVNTVTGTYGRKAFTAFSDGTAEFDLAAGETLRLVLPDAADRDFAVLGACAYAEGEKLVVTRTEPQIEGQDAIPDVTQSVYPGENYMVSGTMKVSPMPVQVRFTNDTYQTEIDVPVRYFLHHPDGSVEEITADSGKWGSFNSVKKTLTGINGSTNDIALLLRKSSTAGVHEYLTTSIRGQYGYTTIGIGAATGNFDEWRTISKNEPSGGSYIRFYHEKLEWSRYAQIWNDYQDAAVYVVFYQRIPVHVTIAKNVVGTEEDKADKSFNFTATFEEHSKTIEYVVTATYRRKRSGWFSDWDNDEGNFDSASTNDYKELTAQADQSLFASSRSSESFSLNDKGRHPITVYFNRSENGVPSGNPTNWKNADTWGNNQTRTQKVKYTVTYQYETVTIQEAEANLFTLTAIDGETGHGHSGTANVVARSYTVSSKKNVTSGGFNGFATYTPLDTAIFTNTRKTGALTVSKTVVGGEAGDTFPFTVTLDETVVDKDNYTPPDGVHLGPYGKVFSFSLANGGSVTLDGLPAGAGYTVAEIAHDKYIATVPANATGTVAADATTAVGFTNTRKTNLAITMKDATVIFTGEEQHGHEISSVTGTGVPIDAEGYTVSGLKNGHVLTIEHYVMPRGTVVGSYTGHVENVRFTVLNANDNDKDVTGEYIITMTPGALTIAPTPIVVTITGKQETKVYNGKEQSVQGYTYVITHATTHEVITSDSVYVSIPPDYQMAWRKDVGRSDMAISANHVIVTVPEGMSVSEVVVAANGWLEVTPAAVTVKADGKVKIQGRSDPPLTATVTGLFGSDTVAYTLSRAAGEAPGAYAITASGEATQGNYEVTYEPGTLTIEELNLIQRSTGADKAVGGDVEITDELIETLGFDPNEELPASTVAKVMNQVDPNGLYRWENIVTGTDTNQVLLSTAVDSSVGAVTIAISRNEGLGKMADLGYLVLQDLRRWYTNGVNSTWNRVAGPSAEKTPTFNIQMTDANGNSLNAAGYYRVFTLLVPQNDLSITNEIPSTNIVGVLEVGSSLKNTMTAVPWNALANDPADPHNITVKDYMTPSQLAVGDSVCALNSNGVYERWTLKAPTRGASAASWKSVPTVVDNGEDGVGVLSATPAADERGLERGNAVWVTREDTSRPYFLVGQYSGNPVQITITGSDSVAVKGSTMITNPKLTPIKINDINWGGSPSEDDVIQVPNGLAAPTVLLWRNGAWGYSAKVYDAKKKRYVKEWKTDVTVPSGMGFWYYRTGAAFTVSIDVDQID